MPQINLLPPEIRARVRSRRIFLIVAGGFGVVVIVLGLVWLVQRNTIGNEEEELQTLQAQRARLQADVAALQQFGELKATVDRTKQVLAAALVGDIAWSKYLNDLSLIIPDNSWLVNLSLSAAAGQAPNGVPSFGTTTFQGFVFDFPGLAGWLTRMSQIDGLTFVYLTTGSKQQMAGREVVSFGANANITQALLSLRCQQEGKPCP
jgi:Tfp pilus assembly protein PilN